MNNVDGVYTIDEDGIDSLINFLIQDYAGKNVVITVVEESE